MRDHVELDRVVKQLKAWRKNKTPRSKIPTKFITDIKKLEPHYKRGQMAKALKMSGAQIKKILDGKQDAQSQEFNFIEIPTSPAAFTIPCILQRQDGTKLTLEIKNEQLKPVVEAFLCCK